MNDKDWREIRRIVSEAARYRKIFSPEMRRTADERIGDSVYTKKDVGLKEFRVVEAGRDGGYGEDIQKAVDRVETDEPWRIRVKENLANWLGSSYYNYVKLMKTLGITIDHHRISWYNWKSTQPLISLVNPGGLIQIKEGNYPCDVVLTLKSAIGLMGLGRDVTQISATTAGQDIITVPNTSSINRVGDFTLSSSIVKNAGAAIRVAGFQGAYDRINIRNNYHGVQIDGGDRQYYDIIDIRQMATGGDGFRVLEGNDHFLNRIEVAGENKLQNGLYVYRTKGTWLDNSDFVTCATGMFLSPPAVVPPEVVTLDALFVHETAFDTNSGNNVAGDAAAPGYVTDPVFVDVFLASAGLSGLDTTRFRGGRMTALRVYRNAAYGVVFGAGSRDNAIDTSLIADNDRDNTGEDGVVINTNVSQVTLSKSRLGNDLGVTSVGSQRYAVRIAGGTTENVKILDNDLIGNLTGPIVEPTNTGYQATNCLILNNSGFNYGRRIAGPFEAGAPNLISPFNPGGVGVAASANYKVKYSPCKLTFITAGTGVALTINGGTAFAPAVGNSYWLAPEDVVNFGAFTLAPTLQVDFF